MERAGTRARESVLARGDGLGLVTGDQNRLAVLVGDYLGACAWRGAGVDVAAARWLAIGMEYRIATPPIAIPPLACTTAYYSSEPVGPPSFFPQRIALTLSVNDAF